MQKEKKNKGLFYNTLVLIYFWKNSELFQNIGEDAESKSLDMRIINWIMIYECLK